MTAMREGPHLKTTFHSCRKERLTGKKKARGSQRKGWKKGNWVMAFGKLAKHMLTQCRIKGGLCCVQRPSHRSSSPSLLAWDSMDIPPESHRPSVKQQWDSSPFTLTNKVSARDSSKRTQLFPASPVSSWISLGNGSCNCSPFLLILALWRRKGLCWDRCVPVWMELNTTEVDVKRINFL